MLNIDKNEKRRKEKKIRLLNRPYIFFIVFPFLPEGSSVLQIVILHLSWSRRHPCKFPHLDELSSLDSLSLRKPACVYCE